MLIADHWLIRKLWLMLRKFTPSTPTPTRDPRDEVLRLQEEVRRLQLLLQEQQAALQNLTGEAKAVPPEGSTPYAPESQLIRPATCAASRC
jgi:hypothetical protein